MKFDFLYPHLSEFNTFSSARWLGFILGCIVASIALCSDAFEVIGHDSILYIQTAELYKQHSFDAAYQQYNWPTYSILIALIHTCTGFTLINSAHLLNIVLVLLLADAFFRLYWEIFPECKFHWIPVVIFLAYGGINDNRYEIFRDWGFWAFAMLTFLYFVKAYNNNGKSNYFLWQICALIAFLFRVEAIVFILMLPLPFLFPKKQILAFIQATSLFWCLGIILLIWLGLNDYFIAGDWGRLGEIASYFQVIGLLSTFKQESLQFAEQLFPHHADSHAVLFMLSGLLGVLLVKILSKLGHGYVLIAVAGWLSRRGMIKRDTVFLVLFLICISLFPVFVYFAITKIITGRYVILASLLMLFFIGYSLEQVIIYCQVNNKKGYLAGLICLLLVNFIVGITHSKSTKIYLKNIGIWTDQNIPKHASVLSNEKRLCFYSKRQPNCLHATFVGDGVLTDKTLRSYDYLLWRMKDQESSINSLLSLGKLKQVYAVGENNPSASAILYKIERL